MLLPEVNAALVLLGPFLNPLLAFVETCVNSVEGGDKLVPQALALVVEIKAIVKGVVAPTGVSLALPLIN